METPLVSGLNAVLGDYLERRGSQLAIPMALYRDGEPVRLDSLEGVGGAKARILVLVHGMAQSESSWSFADDPRHTYGSSLERALGVTPLFLRYNTGRHVSRNGRDLALLLESLVAHLPASTSLEELSFVAHSLGGLVVRSACHYAEQLGHTWIGKLRRAVYLGSPHLGSPLEKAGRLASAVLGSFQNPVVKLLHELAELRGPGVKDLRDGSLVDEDWLPSSASEQQSTLRIPLPAHGEHYFVAGIVTRDPSHVVASLFGDTMVRVESAVAPAQIAGIPLEHSVVLPGISHMQLCHDERVEALILGWFGVASGGAAQAKGPSPPPPANPSPQLTPSSSSWDRVEGYRALLEDAVEQGTLAVQRVQEALTARPYDLIERAPTVVAGPTKMVRAVHEGGVRSTYAAIRLVNRLVGLGLKQGFEQLRKD